MLLLRSMRQERVIGLREAGMKLVKVHEEKEE